MKKFLLAIIIAIPSILASGGDFRITSKLDSISKKGYYKIQISPGIISFAKADYSDIRLVTDKDEEISYILKEEQPATITTGFKEYVLLENQYLEKKKQTRVVIHNSERKVISNLVFVVRNTKVEKEIVIKGSDNNKDWYIIQKGKPSGIGKYSETAEIYQIDFPKSDYEYFEITTNDKLKDPVQFVKVGFYDLQLSQGLYAEVPVKQILQNDSSNKKSYITIKLPGNFEFSKLELKVSGPEFYHRKVYIGNCHLYNNKQVFETIDEFEISSEKSAIWETEKRKLNQLVLVIENLDNKPLKIEEVNVFQLNKYLIARLDSGKTYFIKAGNAELNMPDYDLKFFEDSIPDSITLLKPQQTTVAGLASAEASNIFFTKTIMWIIIIMVIGLLGFLSIRMIKEMGKKE